MRTYPRFTQETLPQTLVLANGAFPTAPTPLALIDHWILGKEGYSLTCCDGAVNKLRRYTDRFPTLSSGTSTRYPLRSRISWRGVSSTSQIRKPTT